MFARHITLYLDFASYFSFTAKIKTHSRIAKFFLCGLIIIGLIGVFFAVAAAYGRTLGFKALNTQMSVSKNIALYNLMTIVLLPAVTETKITGPSGKLVNIGAWFHQSSKWILKPAAWEGVFYFAVIFLFSLLAPIGLIWNFATEEMSASDLLALPLFALGVMMYVHALRRCKAKTSEF